MDIWYAKTQGIIDISVVSAEFMRIARAFQTILFLV